MGQLLIRSIIRAQGDDRSEEAGHWIYFSISIRKINRRSGDSRGISDMGYTKRSDVVGKISYRGLDLCSGYDKIKCADI